MSRQIVSCLYKIAILFFIKSANVLKLSLFHTPCKLCSKQFPSLAKFILSYIVIIYKLSFRVLIEGRNEGVTFNLRCTRFQSTVWQNLAFHWSVTRSRPRKFIPYHVQSHISNLKCSHTLVSHSLSHISNVKCSHTRVIHALSHISNVKRSHTLVIKSPCSW